MSIGMRIAKLRMERHWSITQLAQMIGTNTKSIKDWEGDLSSPTIGNVKKLCKLFHTTPNTLLGYHPKSVVVLDDLPQKDQAIIRAIVQIYYDKHLPYPSPDIADGKH